MTVDMRVPYKQLKKHHVATGPSCMRNENLRCLVGEYALASGSAAVRAILEVTSMYLYGCLPSRFNMLFASATLVPPPPPPRRQNAARRGRCTYRTFGMWQYGRRSARRSVERPR